MEDDPQKNNGKQPKKMNKKMEDDLQKKRQHKKKYLFLIPLKFRGKPFLGLAQLSKILKTFILLFYIKICSVLCHSLKFPLNLLCR